MIILRVACNNLYMFKNFEVDFTYNRKINHKLSLSDKLFEGSRIKVRKNLIIMGANASGKTTFGRLLCLILNFIRGKNFERNDLKIENAQYEKDKFSSFEIEFVVGDTAYLLKAEFENFLLRTEELYSCKIYKSYDIKTLRKKLKETSPILNYDLAIDKINCGNRSYVFAISKNPVTEKVKENISFWFRFSEDPTYSTDYEKLINIEDIGKILPKIDNSVKSVTRLYAENLPTNSYLINFKNGESMTVPDGNLRHCEKRLSHGTFESIDFISILNILNLKKTDFFYIDELLSHMNPELEAYLIRKAFLTKPYDAQIFFTTHNVQILRLNAPINSFMFFKRNDEGFNETLYPSEKINKNDRNLSGYYENDYFGILPDYSVIDSYFDKVQ